MKSIRISGLVIPAAVALATIITLAIRLAAQSNNDPVRYTAAAINMDPSVNVTATIVDLTVTRWSADADRQKLLSVMTDSGQATLLKTLKALPRAGSIKTPDTQSYELHYARRTPEGDGGERVVLVTDRPISFWEQANKTRTLDYPFTVIELHLDANGQGEGKITVAAKIGVDEKSGQIVLENYGTQPVRLQNVKREGK